MTAAAHALEGSDPTTTRRERRIACVQRLLHRGVPLRTLEALLPGWEEEIGAVLDPS